MENAPKLLELLVSWLPMLLLIGVWIYFMRQMQGGMSYVEYRKQALQEQRTHNETMKKLLETMDKRLQRLEGADKEGRK